MLAKCCWNCSKIQIKETDQAKLARAFQAKLNKVGTMYRGNDMQMSCPVTGGILIPASEAMLKKVFTGCMELTCFQPHTNPEI